MDESDFQIDGVAYSSVRHFRVGCDGCAFIDDDKCTEPALPCMAYQRKDGVDVIFVEKHP